MKEIFKYLIQYCILLVAFFILDVIIGEEINRSLLLHTFLILVFCEGLAVMHKKIKASFMKEIEDGVYHTDV